MKYQKKYRRKVVLCFLSSMLLFVSCQSNSEKEIATTTNDSVVQTSEMQNVDFSRCAVYLKEHFGISFSTPVISRADFVTALENLGVPESGIDSANDTKFTLAEAVELAVQAANLEALSLTYARNDSEKALERLAYYNVDLIENANANDIACALDAKLLPSFVDFDFSVEVEKVLAEQLLYEIAMARGEGRNVLGEIADHDILKRVLHFYNSFADIDQFSGEALEVLKAMGNDLVTHGISTGYNLKYELYDSCFLSEFTLQYGHSDITHILQLLTLLHSEGINGYVGLEPKISSFEYLTEWSNPAEIVPTPLYQVVPVDDKWFALALEFDLLIEFFDENDKAKFDMLVNEYAKKWSENQEDDGTFVPSLLDGAWWQPLYLSSVSMENTDTFLPIVEHTISASDGYSLHIFAMEDQSLTFYEHLKNEFLVEQYPISAKAREVNVAFYRYLQGGFE